MTTPPGTADTRGAMKLAAGSGAAPGQRRGARHIAIDLFIAILQLLLHRGAQSRPSTGVPRSRFPPVACDASRSNRAIADARDHGEPAAQRGQRAHGVQRARRQREPLIERAQTTRRWPFPGAGAATRRARTGLRADAADSPATTACSPFSRRCRWCEQVAAHRRAQPHVQVVEALRVLRQPRAGVRDLQPLRECRQAPAIARATRAPWRRRSASPVAKAFPATPTCRARPPAPPPKAWAHARRRRNPRW